MRQTGLFGLSDQLKRLSDCGDPLETMSRVVDFVVFRPALEKALAYGDGTRGGRPPYDPVAMLKLLILAAQNTVSDSRMFEAMLETLAAVVERDTTADMIDSTVVRAHHCAVGREKGIRRPRGSAVRGAASIPSCTLAATARAAPDASS